MSLSDNSSSSAETPCKKRFKITSTSRNLKIGLVASKVSEVLDKGGIKLQARQSTSEDLKLPENLRKDRIGAGNLQYCKVVLDEDGTEVDEDDYLLSLPDDTLLMLLKDGETWNGEYVVMSDELDSASEGVPRGYFLLNKILDRPQSILLMNEEDLEEAAYCDLPTQVLGAKHSAEEMEEAQGACQRLLRDRHEVRETRESLQLMEMARQRRTQTIPES